MMTRKYAMSSRGKGRRYLKDEDFDEEDVWSVVEEAQNSNPSSSSPKKKAGRKPKISSFSASPSFSASASSSSSSSSSPSPSCLWSLTVAPRMIATPQSEEAFNMQHLQRQSSTPVRIPDYGSCSCPRYNCDAGSWMFTNDDHHHHHHVDCGYDSSDSTMMNGTVGCSSNGKYYGGGGCEEEEEEEMVPPHEYIARRLARSQISSFSVCEGIGRTLKGRDLSKVRNAILRKTGFLE